jgi:hypothetical protein
MPRGRSRPEAIHRLLFCSWSSAWLGDWRSIDGSQTWPRGTSFCSVFQLKERPSECLCTYTLFNTTPEEFLDTHPMVPSQFLIRQISRSMRSLVVCLCGAALIVFHKCVQMLFLVMVVCNAMQLTF